MNVLNIVTSPRKEKSASTAIVNAFLAEYTEHLTVSQPGFEYLSGYLEFWLRFIGVRSVVSLTVEHSWDGRAADMIDAGKRHAVELARQF